MPSPTEKLPKDISQLFVERQRFVEHLRRTGASANLKCPSCGSRTLTENDLRKHLREQHPDIVGQGEALRNDEITRLVAEAKSISQTQPPQPPQPQDQDVAALQPRQTSPKRQLAAVTDNPGDPGDQANHGPEEREPKRRIKSPEPDSPSNSNRHQRSRARNNPPLSSQQSFQRSNDFEAVSRDSAGKQLWDESRPGLSRPLQPQHHHRQGAASARVPTASGQSYRRAPASKGGGASYMSTDDIPESSTVNEMMRQPETRPISQEQLVAEVKGIYAGLVMVESKCIEVDNAQNSQNDTSPPLNKEQWQALIALHRTLLHEHHDFFLASQHPAASEALRRLANKYAMPARMWRHGIHSFLELLRHRLPQALEYMQTFIYLAYSMMALLYETVPAFEETWIECLGDLSRYRMAIEDDDLRDREVWTAVSRHWYSKASDKAPSTGRLYHHLAILARPNAVTQLFYYVKSLCVATPFNSARESILTLFEPIMNGSQTKLPALDQAYVKVHSVYFTGKNEDQLEGSRCELLNDLDLSIARSPRWSEPGYHIAVTNICACFEYGVHSNVLVRAMSPGVAGQATASSNDDDSAMEGSGESEKQQAQRESSASALEPSTRFRDILAFTEKVDAIVFARLGDPNILAYLHVRICFIRAMSKYQHAMDLLAPTFNWSLLALALNSLLADFAKPEPGEPERFEQDSMPGAVKEEDNVKQEPEAEPEIPLPNKEDERQKPLPEDWALRGLPWADPTFPAGHFETDSMDDDERYMETPSMADLRRERILWLAWTLAQEERWLLYSPEARQFRPAEAFAADLLLPTVAASKDEDTLPDADELPSSDVHPSEPAQSVFQSGPAKATIVQHRGNDGGGGGGGGEGAP